MDDETAKDRIARALVVAIVPLWWLGYLMRELQSGDPFYDIGRNGFLVASTGITLVLAAIFLPSACVVWSARTTSTRRLVAAMVHVACFAGSIVVSWAVFVITPGNMWISAFPLVSLIAWLIVRVLCGDVRTTSELVRMP